MIEQSSVGVANPTYRVVLENDSVRGERYIFSPIQQAIFWLTHGKDPNQTDGTRVRMPFSTYVSSASQQEFITALQGALPLYSDEIQSVSNDGEEDRLQMLVGSYSHNKRGNPALIIEEPGEGLTLKYTWIEQPPAREKRLQ